MSEWKECKLGDEIVHKKGFAFKSSSYQNTGRIVVRVSDTTSDSININSCNKIDEKEALNYKEYQLIKDDIIIATVGSWPDNPNSIVGKVIRVPSVAEGALLNQNAVRIRSNRSSIQKFIYYRLKSFDFSTYLIGSAQGSANQASITLEDIFNFPILLPPLAEQKAIAGVLSALDDKIDLLHRQNKTLEAMAEALFRQWFVEEAEESWEEGKLGDEFIITMGQSPPGESYNEEGLGIPMYQGNADFEFRFPKNRVFTTDPKRFAEKFDTLISVRAPVGAQNMANERCCIGRGVASLRYKFESELYCYTYYKIRYHMLEIAGYNDTGTVFGSIGKDDLWGIKTFIPTKSEAKEFDSNLKPLNDRIMENCFQIRSLEKLRDTLLPKLMSGEVRVEV